MSRTEHECRWQLLEAYIHWHDGEAQAVAGIWAFYLALGLRAPVRRPVTQPPQEDSYEPPCCR